MDSSCPIVTVLMPVFNGENFLSEAIESILNQTFTNFEFLILDDCSTDQSVPIIQSYKDERIKLIINGENMGQSGTMNRGIELAMGKYIARLDQDDLSREDRLQVQIEKISGLNKTILGSYTYAIDKKSQIIGYSKFPLDNDSIIDALAISSPLAHSSIFMKKEDIVSLGGYSNKYKIAMDWDLWIRAANMNYNFINIPEYLVGLRIHGKQISQNNKGKKVLNKETLSLMRSSKNIIKTKKNLHAFIGWNYYHEILFILYNYKPDNSLYKLIFYLVNFKSLYEFLKIFVYHKILNKPQKLYNTPVHFTETSNSKKASNNLGKVPV